MRNEDGSVEKFGPRDEKEELKAQDEWMVRIAEVAGGVCIDDVAHANSFIGPERERDCEDSRRSREADIRARENVRTPLRPRRAAVRVQTQA